MKKKQVHPIFLMLLISKEIVYKSDRNISEFRTPQGVSVEDNCNQPVSVEPAAPAHWISAQGEQKVNTNFVQLFH